MLPKLNTRRNWEGGFSHHVLPFLGIMRHNWRRTTFFSHGSTFALIRDLNFLGEPMSKPAPKTKRILELDALRAIAALNLLLFHFTLVYANKYGFDTPLGFEFPYGKYGVQLFFMLSGFVNAMTLLKKRKPGEFLVSRFIRIFPSFWLVVLLNLILFSCFSIYAYQPTGDQLVANMTVMPGLFGYDCWEPVTWTLQVEMLFYGILMILFMGGAFNNPIRTMMIMIGISFFGVPLVEHCQVQYAGTQLATISAFLSDLFILKYLPLFAMGILLHQIKSQNGNKFANMAAVVASAVVFHSIDDHGHNPAATVILFGMLAFSAYGKLPPLRFKPLMFISAISYSLYLFHNNLGCLVIKSVHQCGASPLASFLIGIAFSVLIAALITYYFERPISGWLRQQWTNLKHTAGESKLLTSWKIVQPSEKQA